MRVPVMAIIWFVLVCSCNNDRRLDVEYYSNGEMKHEVEMKGELQHGMSKFYNESGKLEYMGVFDMGKRTGEHIAYFQNEKVKRTTVYVIEDEREKWIEDKLFGEDGLIELHRIRAEKKIHFSILNQSEVSPYDSVKIKVKLIDSKYPNSIVVVGDIDENLRSLDQRGNRTYIGNENHEVLIDHKASEGTNVIRGLFRDFKFEPYPQIDTLGYTVAEDSYFEFEFHVKKGNTI